MSAPAPRKGARRVADVPPEVLAAINAGETATVNLVEFLAADLRLLLPAIAARIGLDPAHPRVALTVDRLLELKPMRRHWAIAACLFELIGDDAAACARLAGQTSDLARQWAAMFPGLRPGLSLAERLDGARPFAADTHFGVREIAWLAVRDAVVLAPEEAIELLLPWTLEADANLRRFASELTRPRGVWCAHIDAFKQNPAPGLALLEPLRADPSRYVQDSVANWLNDAAKNHPDWTRGICERWLAGDAGKATQYIARRAQRSLVV